MGKSSTKIPRMIKQTSPDRWTIMELTIPNEKNKKGMQELSAQNGMRPRQATNAAFWGRMGEGGPSQRTPEAGRWRRWLPFRPPGACPEAAEKHVKVNKMCASAHARAHTVTDIQPHREVRTHVRTHVRTQTLGSMPSAAFLQYRDNL